MVVTLTCVGQTPVHSGSSRTITPWLAALGYILKRDVCELHSFPAPHMSINKTGDRVHLLSQNTLGVAVSSDQATRTNNTLAQDVQNCGHSPKPEMTKMSLEG